MPEKKPPMPVLRRRAYHEAGHAVLAIHYSIAVDHVSLNPTSPEKVPKFQSLADFCQLHPGQDADRVKLERYLIFLMAGSVAEMLASERYLGLEPRTPAWRRYRARCFEMLWRNPEIHLDLAFYCLAIWRGPSAICDIYSKLDELWKTTCRLVECLAIWPKIERVAGRLLLHGELDAETVSRLVANHPGA